MKMLQWNSCAEPCPQGDLNDATASFERTDNCLPQRHAGKHRFLLSACLGLCHGHVPARVLLQLHVQAAGSEGHIA